MQQQQRDDGLSRQQKFNLVHWLCLGHQRALTIPMRNQYGKEALGTPCLLALVLMFLWTICTRDSLMWLWMGGWFLFFLKRRAEAVQLASSGRRIHSLYDGWPFDAIRLGKTEKTAKLVVEPILTGILGGLLYWVYDQQGWSPAGLPYFVLAGVFTLPFIESVKQAAWERRTQAMADARLEQEQVMHDYREKYGDS